MRTTLLTHDKPLTKLTKLKQLVRERILFTRKMHENDSYYYWATDLSQTQQPGCRITFKDSTQVETLAEKLAIEREMRSDARALLEVIPDLKTRRALPLSIVELTADKDFYLENGLLENVPQCDGVRPLTPEEFTLNKRRKDFLFQFAKIAVGVGAIGAGTTYALVTRNPTFCDIFGLGISAIGGGILSLVSTNAATIAGIQRSEKAIGNTAARLLRLKTRLK